MSTVDETAESSSMEVDPTLQVVVSVPVLGMDETQKKLVMMAVEERKFNLARILLQKAVDGKPFASAFVRVFEDRLRRKLEVEVESQMTWVK